MEDLDHVCPLCCEELDISDREFYPCKCGYQVCMWCWHRIRESESGLCPACRTPYGEDPHQFSAVDVEEVLKANKEKEAAAKRERQRLHNEEDGGPGAMEVPKDRTQLANMRVIRRNLVYAVGLPPNAATEETLRKPEYFGQYGKIAKIVLNRTQVQAGGDPRRASASAYVTFVHKEDTLACILALDGFYLENRNIRASYGTSKYCSAFIKNVRCNNPECTYLHEMGATEDTFTKQEIQAGYVTSGRDVLARQQQIAAEQLRQGTTAPRKRIGGGGPSATGKACANPVFPIPEYDEPTKPSAPLVPPPSGIARANTSPLSLNPSNISAKLGRSTSVTMTSSGGKSPTLSAQAVPPAVALPATTHRKSQSTGGSSPPPGAAVALVDSLVAPATAASVVVSGRSLKSDTTESHSTLTPLTPLKRIAKPASARSASMGAQTSSSSDSGLEKLTPLRNGTNKKQNGARANSGISGAPDMPSEQGAFHPSGFSIGGDVIGPPKLKPRSASVLTGIGGDPAIGIDGLGGSPVNLNAPTGSHSSALGGELFTGQLHSTSSYAIGSSAIGGGMYSGDVGGVSLCTGPMLPANNSALGGFWNGAGMAPTSNFAPNPPPVGGSFISSRAPGPPSADPNPNGSSSSALASLLGINLPTGSGSLHESSNLWTGPGGTAQPSLLSSLNSSAVPVLDVFGGRSGYSGSSLIGGVPIGGSRNAPGTIGGGNNTDIALLQSLLPGVHITRGADPMTFGAMPSNPGWSGGGAPGGWAQTQGVGPGGLNGEVIGGGNLNVGVPPSAGSTIGPIGHAAGNQNQRRGPAIW